MIFLWIVVTVLSLLVSICLMALVDQYQTLQLIRGRLELDDAPAPVVIPGDRVLAPSAIGLPAELDHREHLVVLFLSTTCATCRALAKKLGGRPRTTCGSYSWRAMPSGPPTGSPPPGCPALGRRWIWTGASATRSAST